VLWCSHRCFLRYCAFPPNFLFPTTYASLLREYPDDVQDHGEEVNFQIELNLKYAGYIDRQNQEIARLSRVENIIIPPCFNFATVKGLRNEARHKLSQTNPLNLGQASRISGVSPADISVLLIALVKKERTKK